MVHFTASPQPQRLAAGSGLHVRGSTGSKWPRRRDREASDRAKLREIAVDDRSPHIGSRRRPARTPAAVRQHRMGACSAKAKNDATTDDVTISRTEPSACVVCVRRCGIDRALCPSTLQRRLLTTTIRLVDGRVRCHFAAVERDDSAIATTPSLAALKRDMAHLAAGEFSAREVVLDGLRMVHRSRLGRHLQFVVLREHGGATLEGVLRLGVLDGGAAVSLNERCQAGDALRVQGLVERSKGKLSLHVRSLAVVRRGRLYLADSVARRG